MENSSTVKEKKGYREISQGGGEGIGFIPPRQMFNEPKVAAQIEESLGKVRSSLMNDESRRGTFHHKIDFL